ncbi:MAG TPA: CoA transferase [Ideonella sp.]|uniref:CaiB/BaiF CoA transferase family protein n=1 Tax=Ideonella sp. TaxID=1929293 RepID=UPI002CED2D28|nr:CoA transferase [Ideonella sp.]HSI47100.1 CoA transferase [Ideonella sp.]
MSNSNSSAEPLPLEGVKVVELAHLIAGPYCCQMLADEGATVIKVEPPSGDLTRHRLPARRTETGDVTAYYASLNRGKQSLVLDLKNEHGKELMLSLLETADVFVTNMRAAALARLGLHPKSLHERFPRLVIACISGFGLDNSGDYADRAGLAIVAEAMSGATGLTRDHSGNPVWCGFALGDITASVSAHAAVILALRNQERFGVGKLIDLGLVECMLPMVSVAMGRAQVDDEVASSFTGSNNFHGIPYGAFPASDGAVSLGVNRDDFWARFCVAMGRPELGTDPRYATYVERAKRQREVHAFAEEFTRAHTRAEITAKLVEADVPVASILGMKEVILNDYLRERGSLWEVDDGHGGTFTLPANTAWLEKPRKALRVPRLGEHRDSVLKEHLGLSASDIAQLDGAGAFGVARDRSKPSSEAKSDVVTSRD